MATAFDAACREYATRPAYRVGGDWVTYAGCHARVARLAASLADRLRSCRRATGRRPVIAIMLPNSSHALESLFVAAVTDSILVALTDRPDACEIETALRTSGASILLTSDDFAPALVEVGWDTVPVRTIVWTGAGVDLPVEEHRSWTSLLTASPPARQQSRPAPTSSLQRPGASATTVRTNIVVHPHRNVLLQSLATIEALGLGSEEDQCWAHVAPMSDVGNAAFVWIALLLGARHVFHETPLDLVGVGCLLAGERVTMAKLSPSLLRSMCESDAIRARRFPHLRSIAASGEAPDPDLARRVTAVFGCDLVEGVGAIEPAEPLADPSHPIRAMTDRRPRT